VIDLHPATERTIRVITALADDQLDLPTPCPDAVVGDLVDHLGVFALRFRAAAGKETGGPPSPPPPPPPPSGANLEAGWRERIARDLDDLADAWSDPRAWEGSTHAGGLEMPADVVGVVALDELIVHGWDLAVATGQGYEVPVPEIDAAIGFVAAFEAPRDGRLFGPIVPVADDATPLERLLSLTGRDPGWQPEG
jgi:uncharacterized protein (TIGR03086 family)